MKPDTPLGRLAACLDEHTETLVTEYFDPSSGFAGSTFDLVGVNDPCRVGRDDLLALTCLDEHVPPSTLRWFESDAGQAKMRELLHRIPNDVELGPTAEPATIAAANEAWQFLAGRVTGEQKLAGVGPVKAGKLLSRKRPLLVPIVDRVVIRVVDAGKEDYWEIYSEFMADDSNITELERLRTAAGAADVSLLRVLDAAVWLRGSGSEFAYAARDRLNVPDLAWAPRPNRTETTPEAEDL